MKFSSRNGAFINYVWKWEEGVIQNAYSCVKQDKGITHRVYVHICYILFYVFGITFILQCLVLIVKTYAYPYSVKMYSSKWEISCKVSVCRHEINFFYFKLFWRTKVSQALIIFLKWNVRSSQYFTVVLYFGKILCGVTQEIRYELDWYYCLFFYLISFL